MKKSSFLKNQLRLYAKLLPLLALASCGFFKNSLHMQNSDSSTNDHKLSSFSISVSESTKSLATKTGSKKSLGIVDSGFSGFNLATNQPGSLAADKFTAILTGCTSGLSAIISGNAFQALKGDTGCIVKLKSLTIHNRTYTSSAAGAQDFSSWSAGQIARFAEAGTGNTIEVLVVSQLSSGGVQNSDYVSYLFTILTHNSDVIVSSSHQLLVAGQDAPNFEIINTSIDFINNTLTFQLKCTNGLLISDGSQNTFCPSFNGASYASGAGVDIAAVNHADDNSLFNYALIPYDANLNLTSARAAVTAAALASPAQLATVQTPNDLLNFSGNNDNFGFQTIALHSPELLTSANPFRVILIMQAKNTGSIGLNLAGQSGYDINKSSFQYIPILIKSAVNDTCSTAPGICLVTISGGNAIAQTSGGSVTNTLADSGTSNVSVNSQYTLFFGTPTDPSAFTVMNSTDTNSGNLRMSCNNVTQTGTVASGSNNQTVVFTLDQALPPLTSCTLTIGTYHDAIGHSGVSGHSYSFTTGCVTDDGLDGQIDTSSCYSPIWLAPEFVGTTNAPNLTSSFQTGAYKLDVNSPTDQLAFPTAAYYKQFIADRDFTATITLKSFAGISGGNSSNQLGGDSCVFEALTSSSGNPRLALSLMNSKLYTAPGTSSGSGYLSIMGIASGAQVIANAVSSDSNATSSDDIYSSYSTNPIKFQIKKVGTTFTAKYSIDGGNSFVTIQSQTILNFGPSFYLTFGGSKYTSSGAVSCSFGDFTISDDTNSTYLSAIGPEIGGQDGAPVNLSATNSNSPVITDLVATLNNLGLSGRNVTLTWTNVSNATNYHVLRKAESTGSYAEIGTSNSTPYIDSNTQYGVKYFYKVDADFSQQTVHSNIVSVKLITYCQATIPLPSWEDSECYNHHMFDTPEGCAADAFCQWGDHGAGLRCVSATFTKSNSYCAQQGINSCQPGWCSWIDGEVSTATSNVTVGTYGDLATATVGDVQTVTFHCKNSSGSEVSNSCSGPVVFQFANDGTSDGTFSDAIYNVNMATWTANFTATTVGTARSVTALYNGTAITSTLPTITVLSSSNLSVTHNLSLWLDARASNTVQDASSVSVSNGGQVSNWLDRRLNGKYVTASNYASSGVPSYDTSSNSEAIVFSGPDGINTDGQRLVGDLSSGGGEVFSTGPQVHTIFTVYDQNDLFYTTWPNLFRIGDPNSNQNIAFHTANVGGVNIYYFYFNDLQTSAYLSPYKNSKTLLVLRYDGSTRKIRSDGLQVASDAPGLSLNLQTDILEIGNYYRGGFSAGTFSYYGKIHEMLFYNSALNETTEIPQIEAYLREKWNTP